MSIRFGTDGWRALIAEDFTFDNVARVIQAYAEVLVSSSVPLRRPIPLGFDRRFLSEDFAKTVASVLAANGLMVSIAKSYCPTPCISWMSKATDAPGGVVITASHNPYRWNGVKFKEGYGGSASPEFTAKVEEAIQSNLKKGAEPKRIPFEEGVRQGKIVFFDPTADYVGALRSQIDVSAIRKSGWKIAYDPLYGAGAGYLEKVLDLPIREIHGDSNPGFGGLNPEPIEKNLSALIQIVRDQSQDVGLATDGDADRIGAVDENGRFVNSHQIFALILNHLIETGHRGDVVKTVSTTRMIDQIAARHGIKVHETPIGFKHICTKFLQIEPLMGGEESGGIGIPSHVYERDGLLCGLILLAEMASKKKRLGEILKDLEREIGPFQFRRDDVHLGGDDLARLREGGGKLSPDRLAGLKVMEINRSDGTKFLLEDESWLLLRVSGTEPLVRIYAEASTKDATARLVEEGRRLLKLPQS